MPGYVEKFINRDAEEVARLELLDHYAERYIDSNVVDKGKEWQASSHIQEAQDKGERDLQKAMQGFSGSYRELLAREESRDFEQLMAKAPEMPPLWRERPTIECQPVRKGRDEEMEIGGR